MKFNGLAMETERGDGCVPGILSGLPLGRIYAPRSGFTMVEIAICLAVIGFALVAIIGVLPTGMQVQRDNREETIINQDGAYFMEAIRSGARDLHNLTQHVTQIEVLPTDPGSFGDGHLGCTSLPNAAYVSCPAKVTSGSNIIAALSTPQCWPLPFCDPADTPPRISVYRTRAHVRSISGSAVEKGSIDTLTFEYMLTSEIVPFTAVDPNLGTKNAFSLHRNLYELRLTFQWPLQYGGKVGTGRKVFRAMLSGSFETNEPSGYFFREGEYGLGAQPNSL